MAARRILLEPKPRPIGLHRPEDLRTDPAAGSAAVQAYHRGLLGHSPAAAEAGGRARPGSPRAGNEARARRILGEKLAYVYDRSFDDPDAEATILAPMPAGARERPARPGPSVGPSPELGGFFGDATLLRPEQEAHLFLKMNYLKYRASKLREALDPARARASVLDEIERLQGEAQAVKDRIVRSCLRLVISIARRKSGPGRDFLELVSEGNLSLILAAEKFDVSRGFKFSTYASCSILRNFSRTAGREIGRQHQFLTGQPELLEATPSRPDDDRGREDSRRGHQEAVVRMVGELGDRERRVIVSRFGLEGADEKTLSQLGKELGISKERVRQIELRAREKLRKLATEQGLDPTAA